MFKFLKFQKLLFITEQNNDNKQYLILVKLNGVFLSYFEEKESSPLFQFHIIKGYDSQRVVTRFMQDSNYEPRNFATLIPSR